MNEQQADFRCGYVALIGRPNVGKSTLLNRILGQKVSITSRKPQTTRHRILGIKTTATEQVIYVDTPGLHKHAKRAMNRYMNRAATTILEDVHLIIFIIEALKWTDEDDLVLKRLAPIRVPVILAVNKIDKVADKKQLLPFLQQLSEKRDFLQIIPLSASKGSNVDELENIVREQLDMTDAYFPEDQITDKSERFLAAEIIREKLMRNLGQELPYDLTVEIEKFEEAKDMYQIHAIIWVERQNQKAIVIGKAGERLKLVGTQARSNMQKLFDKKIFLQLWVKVKEGWSDDERALLSLGYSDEL